MKLLSLNTAGIALIVLSLVMPTGAVVGAGESPADTVWEDGGVALTPTNASNGEYAEIGPDGNLSVDLASVGLNPDAVTVVADVFRIENRGDRPVRVWVTHDGDDAVSVFAGSDRTNIEGNESELELAPGAAIAVGFRIDTSGRAAGETLMRNLRVHAYRPDAATPTPTPTETSPPPSETPTTTPAETPTETTTEGTPVPTTTDGTPGTPTGTATVTPNGTPTRTATVTPNETTTVTPNETATITPGTGTPATPVSPPDPPPDPPTEPPTSTPDTVESIEVVFDVAVDDAEVEIRELDGVPEEADQEVISNPRALISAEGVSAVGGESTRDGGENRRFDSLVLTNTTVTLDGQASLVSTSESVDRSRRLAKVVEITPPDGMEDESATIQVRLNKSRLQGTAPEDARIGRRDDDGWQLLSTRIVEETERSVLLEARTPGFSVFGVWLTTEVRYSWEIESVGTRTGERVDVNFPSPGLYNATLTVTDAFDRRDVTEYRILANDRPDVSLQAEGNLTPGTPLNLTALVADRLGDRTVTWKFEDGTSRVGTEVVRSFEPGRHVIEIRVEDEYGAATTREFAVTVPGPDEAAGGSIDPLDASVPQNVQSGIVGALGFSLLLIRRRRDSGGWGVLSR